jgi:hypothetical protein
LHRQTESWSMEILLILKFLINNFVFLNKPKNQSHIKLFSAVL